MGLGRDGDAAGVGAGLDCQGAPDSAPRACPLFFFSSSLLLFFSSSLRLCAFASLRLCVSAPLRLCVSASPRLRVSARVIFVLCRLRDMARSDGHYAEAAPCCRHLPRKPLSLANSYLLVSLVVGCHWLRWPRSSCRPHRLPHASGSHSGHYCAGIAGFPAGSPPARRTGIAGFPAGSPPARLDAASAASWPIREHMRARPAGRAAWATARLPRRRSRAGGIEPPAREAG